MSGDEILLVSHLVTFLYTGNYADEDEDEFPDLTPVTPVADLYDYDPVRSNGHHSRAVFTPSPPMDVEPEVADGKIDEPEQSPDYSLDVKMYALSDQYDIPALGTLATAKLDKALTDHWDSKSFIEIVPRVYESTLGSNLGLRTVVLTHARKHGWVFMQEGPLKSSFYTLLATTPDFCTALLSLYMSQPPPFPGATGSFADFVAWNGYNASGSWSGRGRGLVNAADDRLWPGMWPGMSYADLNRF